MFRQQNLTIPSETQVLKKPRTMGLQTMYLQEDSVNKASTGTLGT